MKAIAENTNWNAVRWPLPKFQFRNDKDERAVHIKYYELFIHLPVGDRAAQMGLNSQRSRVSQVAGGRLEPMPDRHLEHRLRERQP